MRRDLTRPAILGGFDGTASLLGVIVFLAFAHPSLVFPAALSGAVSSALSMGGGEWLSDSDNGFGASLVMAAATFTGALVPALPFVFGSGTPAIAESVIICCCVAVAVAAMRDSRGLGLALAETFGILAAVAAVTVGLGLVLPGGAG